MAEAEEKPPEATEAKSGKSGKGLVVVVLVAAVVLGGGAAAAGAVVAMRVGGGSAPAAAAPAASAEEKVGGTIDFSAIVVDIHAADGTGHHLRVSLTGEVAVGVPKEEMSSLMPRGREAAIGYLRSLTYEEATAPHSFETVKAEISKRIVEACGEKKIVSVLVTDFVTQ
jgi:flagellar basal body-associated protein FliL